MRLSLRDASAIQLNSPDVLTSTWCAKPGAGFDARADTQSMSEDILQRKLQYPRFTRLPDLAERPQVGDTRGRVHSPEAIGDVIGFRSELHPLIFAKAESSRQRQIK